MVPRTSSESSTFIGRNGHHSPVKLSSLFQSSSQYLHNWQIRLTQIYHPIRSFKSHFKRLEQYEHSPKRSPQTLTIHLIRYSKNAAFQRPFANSQSNVYFSFHIPIALFDIHRTLRFTHFLHQEPDTPSSSRA